MIESIAHPPAPPRSPWQRLYAAVLERRAERLRATARRLPRPIVSVGNLHWGGGGKTPFTLAVAARLRDAGLRVAILSRGYRRSTSGPLVVSRGAGPLVPVEQAGDEPYLMATKLAGVAVIVGERRYEAGELALVELADTPDLFVLDDGFSHLALARDVDLLLFPADDPWARGRLAPGGRLREPLGACRRADAVIVTSARDAASGRELARAIAPYGYSGPGFSSWTDLLSPALADGDTLAAGTRVLAVAAIARPGAFFAAADGSSLEVVARRSFRDHRLYSQTDLREIREQARRAGAEAVLTTEKDRAKLLGRLALPLAVLPISARPEPAFWSWLDRRLEATRR